MKINESWKHKKITLNISYIVIVISILLYYFDTSFAWGIEKVRSCLIVNFWLFFMPAAIRYGYLYLKDRTTEDSARIGGRLGVLGLIPLILMAPYFGIKYYLLKEDQ